MDKKEAKQLMKEVRHIIYDSFGANSDFQYYPNKEKYLNSIRILTKSIKTKYRR